MFFVHVGPTRVHSTIRQSKHLIPIIGPILSGGSLITESIPRRNVQATLEIRAADQVHREVHARAFGGRLEFTGLVVGLVN